MPFRLRNIKELTITSVFLICSLETRTRALVEKDGAGDRICACFYKQAGSNSIKLIAFASNNKIWRRPHGWTAQMLAFEGMRGGIAMPSSRFQGIAHPCVCFKIMYRSSPVELIQPASYRALYELASSNGFAGSLSGVTLIPAVALPPAYLMPILSPAAMV